MSPKPLKSRSKPWTGQAKSRTYSTRRTRRLSTKLSKASPTSTNWEFDATILLDQLDQLDQRDQHKAPDNHWIFTSPAAMIGAAVCLFELGYCIWRCCCRTSTMIQPQPSAPLMPMPTVQTQHAGTIKKMQNNRPRNNGTLNDQNAKNNLIPINITNT
jgi:hypothetical protein